VLHAVRPEGGAEDFRLVEASAFLLQIALHHVDEQVEEKCFVALERHEEATRVPALLARHGLRCSRNEKAVPT